MLGAVAILTLLPSVLASVPQTSLAGPPPGTRYLDSIYESTVTSDINFGSIYNPSFQRVETLRMDLYEPENDPEPLRVAVIWVHGGGFVSGDKSEVIPVCEDLASRGYVAVAPNYRLKQRSGSQNYDPAYAAGDIASAVRYLRANASLYRIDPDRIVLAGSSSGACISLAAAYDDLVIGMNSNHWGWSSDAAAVVEVSGAMVRTDRMETGEEPVMIIHGLLDNAIHIQRAVDIRDQAEAVGIHHEAQIFPNAGHALMAQHGDAVIAAAVDFIYRNVVL